MLISRRWDKPWASSSKCQILSFRFRSYPEQPQEYNICPRRNNRRAQIPIAITALFLDQNPPPAAVFSGRQHRIALGLGCTRDITRALGIIDPYA